MTDGPYRTSAPPTPCKRHDWIERWYGPPGSWGPVIECGRCGQRPLIDRALVAFDRVLATVFGRSDGN